MKDEPTALKRLQLQIAERIRTKRKGLELSQEQLAERAGLSHNYIARLELGWNSPSLSTLLSLASALGMHASDLLATEETWRDRGRDLAHSLDGLTAEEVEYVTTQFRASLDFIKKKRNASGGGA